MRLVLKIFPRFCPFIWLSFTTQYRSYGDVPALLVGEDLRFPFVHYFSLAEPPPFRKLAGKLPHTKESKLPGGIRTHSGEDKWFEGNDLYHSATSSPLTSYGLETLAKKCLLFLKTDVVMVDILSCKGTSVRGRTAFTSRTVWEIYGTFKSKTIFFSMSVARPSYSCAHTCIMSYCKCIDACYLFY
jgi:hypothetical protein